MKVPPPPLGLRSLSAGIAAAGLALTAALGWTASTVNRNSDARLLQLQVRQAAAAITASLPSVETQLVDALQVATNTHNWAAFKRFSAPKAGPRADFASISLWEKTGAAARELARVGNEALLVTDGRSGKFFATVHPAPVLQVTSILPGVPPHLGYAEMAPGDKDLIVYAESVLPTSRRLVVPKSSAFNDLNFALYFGKREANRYLIEASVPTPVKGLHASSTVPLGDATLTIVGSPTRQLAGALSADLEWIVLAVGGAISLATAATVEYVLRRRAVAEALAAENERLYVEQRNIAGTLQHALLPGVPALGPIEAAARYLPGVEGIDVGGDWYDIINLGPSHCVFVVGDVSGRGLGAATTMASLRFSTRAYVAQGDEPATVLRKLSDLLDFDSTQRFATVLIGELDLARQRLTLANAGHLPPLLVRQGDASYLRVPTGTPLGITGPERPDSVTVEVQRGCTMLAFTDGLVERRGEHLEEGLERLRLASLRETGPVEKVLDRLAAELMPAGSADDTVILGLRWR